MLEAINDINDDCFNVVWDLGRRCTFSCSYCGPHHSNKTSVNTSLDVLKHTVDGIVEYTNIINSYLKHPKKIILAFTGGEPTINPNFFNFIEYTKKTYPHLKTNITTNGCYNLKKCQQIIDNVNNCTISYHTEASNEEKKLVRSGIEHMKKLNYNFRINLMFHKDYFDECIAISKWLDKLGVRYTPRVIGDSNNLEDIKDGTAHVYNDEQLQWLKNYWNEKKQKINNNVNTCDMGSNIGRPCCSSKPMQLLIDQEWSSGMFVPHTNFYGWNCMVNWYFLFINSELDGVWHHQSCQVDLNGQIGPIGKASNFKLIIDNLKNNLIQNTIPLIKCPKTYCGCGLCATKAKDDNQIKQLFNSKINKLQPILQHQAKDIDKKNSIINLLKQIG